MKFAFYDLEITGISPAFDQPLQFAAILTDAEFGEIEWVNLQCRIAPHIIPSPSPSQRPADAAGRYHRQPDIADRWVTVIPKLMMRQKRLFKLIAAGWAPCVELRRGIGLLILWSHASDAGLPYRPVANT